jgi:O-antigen/teichoic acid export membrane protein
MRFKAISFIQITMLVVSGTASITMAALGFEVWALVLSGLLGSALNVVLSGITARWRPRFAFDRQVLKRLGGYGIKVSAVNIVLYLKKQTGNFIIGRFIGPAAVGLFNKAFSLQEMPGLVTSSAHNVIFRTLSSIQDNLDQSKYVYLGSLTLATVYSFPFFVGLWWVAEPFIYTVYGPKWIGSAEVLEILVPAGIFGTVGSLSGAVGAARRLLGREFLVQMFTWAFIATAAAFAYRWGITGIAWVMLAEAIVTSILMASIACRELHTTISELFVAIRPALLLNSILMFSLALAHISALSGYKTSQPALYLAAMTAVGAIVYGFCFLYLPVPQLATEAHRWKRKMHLARK